MADRPVEQQERAIAESVTGVESPQRLTAVPGAPPRMQHDVVEVQAGAVSLRDAITLLTDEVRRSRANVVRLVQPVGRISIHVKWTDDKPPAHSGVGDKRAELDAGPLGCSGGAHQRPVRLDTD